MRRVVSVDPRPAPVRGPGLRSRPADADYSRRSTATNAWKALP
jgi:hypothetical protein